MDLKFSNAEPSADERDAVDRLLGVGDGGWHGGERDEKDHRRAHTGQAARAQRHLVMEALHAVNDRVGWISPGALNYVGKRLSMAAADVYSVATFYALFSTNMRPKRIVHVCTDIACMARGSKEVCADLEKRLGPAGAMNGWKHSPCLGVCERAPAAMAVEAGDPPHEHLIGPATVDEVVLALKDGPHALAAEAPPVMAVPQAGQEDLMLLKRVGQVDPESIDDYIAKDGYAGLKRAFEMGPGQVISEVKDSKLMGRGGAAFPAGIKWESTAKQPATPRYLVCNADESEPGTFKDRAILEGDPFALIESMTIAGYAIGAERGYIYLRGEYPRAHRLLQNAIDRARGRGFLGDNVMGKGWHFELEIRRGAGAYICGEETAIFNSIEGYRGEPRSKPPFPFEAGLFGKPTVVNNVETLCNVPLIMQMGGAQYAKIGTEGSTGPKLFCVSGNLVRPGVYEVPFGATLGDVLKLAGGVPEGRKLQAVLLGGAAGGFVRADELHIPLTFEGARANNTTLGSGVVLAFDDTVDLPAILLRIARFFRDESCGQCVPCRVGTVRQEEALLRIARNRSDTGATGRDVGLLRDVGLVMKDASICGLGQAAWNAVESAIDRLGVLEKKQMNAPVQQITISIDGKEVSVPEGSIILTACNAAGKDTPTLCYGDTLTPKNACRVCMVELKGSRVLVPSCSRKVQPGMEVFTDTDRVRHSRRLVLELLDSSVDLSTTPHIPEWKERYNVDSDRYGPRASKSLMRDVHDPGEHHAGNGSVAATMAQPDKIDNDLYVREYDKCILCYKCVDACGPQWQNSFAIQIAGRGFDSQISTEFAVELPESACVFCGNCVEVCPTGALSFKSEYDMRAADTWDESKQTTTTTVCTYCGVGCNLELHVQDNKIVKVNSPHDHSVSHGNLCIKGRFGFVHVQSREEDGNG